MEARALSLEKELAELRAHVYHSPRVKPTSSKARGVSPNGDSGFSSISHDLKCEGKVKDRIKGKNKSIRTGGDKSSKL